MLANYSAGSARWRTYADAGRSLARDRASTTPRTIALRFYARGMAVNLYRITRTASHYRAVRPIESLASVEVRRVPDPGSGLAA